jgi:hypothetical protein
MSLKALQCFSFTTIDLILLLLRHMLFGSTRGLALGFTINHSLNIWLQMLVQKLVLGGSHLCPFHGSVLSHSLVAVTWHLIFGIRLVHVVLCVVMHWVLIRHRVATLLLLRMVLEALMLVHAHLSSEMI